MLRRLVSKVQRDERGFTLIELMIVILVILVLAAILIPQFGLARERARKASCVSNQRNLETAVAMWQTDNPSLNLTSGQLSATTAVPNDAAPTATNPSLNSMGTAGFPQYTTPAAVTEPDSGITTGRDYWLAGGTATNPSYGHVICYYAYAAPANPDGWAGLSGPAGASATGGGTFNHARGTTASP